MAAPLIELSARLRALADRVLDGAPMADVGTDHAYLPAWLLAHGRVPRAIGTDVAEAPLRAAGASVGSVAGLQLRRGDGLSAIADDEVATVVIAGMGGARIRRLVDARVPAGVRRLVLQPNTEWAATREWIAARGFPLDDEALVDDRGKTYLVLVVRPEPGTPHAWTEEDLELGPILRRSADPIFEAWRLATRDDLHRAVLASTTAHPDDRNRTALLHRLAIFEGRAPPRDGRLSGV